MDAFSWFWFTDGQPQKKSAEGGWRQARRPISGGARFRTSLAKTSMKIIFVGAIASLAGILLESSAQTTTVIPASWAYPAGSQEQTAIGFVGKIHQARNDASLSATISRGNAQLNGTLVDPQSGQPYQNFVVTRTNEYATNGLWLGLAVEVDGTFVETNMVNYSIETGGLVGDLGLFNSASGHTDKLFPGLPGASDPAQNIYENVGNFGIEEMAFLELKKGTYIFGVNSDDTFELSFHPNDARDIFRTSVASFGSNRGSTDSRAVVEIEEDGLYSVRLMHAQYQSSPPAELELYTADPNDETVLRLVNDRSNPEAVKAWRALSIPPRPYVKSVSPSSDSTGVDPTTTIRAVFANVGNVPPVMKVNGNTVNAAPSTANGETTLTYTPSSPFPGGSVISVDLEYGGASGHWSFVTRTGVKALMIVGGTATASDNWMAARLASKFGLDVSIKTDSAAQTNDAAGTVLIVNSATVNSGNVASKNFEELPIPILNGEQANVDDFLLGTTGGNVDLRQIEVVDGSHPIAAGLLPGVYDVYNVGVVNQCHNAGPAESATPVAVNASNSSQTLIFALDEGAEFQGFVHPARRVHLGIVGNDGGNRFNEIGIKLFDAAVRWLMKLPDPSLQFNTPTLANDKITLSWGGNGTLEEAGAVTGPWTPAPSQTNPQEIPATGTKFFRLKQ